MLKESLSVVIAMDGCSPSQWQSPDEAGDCNDRRKEHLSHKDIEQ